MIKQHIHINVPLILKIHTLKLYLYKKLSHNAKELFNTHLAKRKSYRYSCREKLPFSVFPSEEANACQHIIVEYEKPT